MINIPKKIDRNVVCELINASIEEEANAKHEYAEILKAIPRDEEYEECSDAIVKIMEDEVNHAITLIKIGRALGCKKPELDEDDEDIVDIVNHIQEIEIK